MDQLISAVEDTCSPSSFIRFFHLCRHPIQNIQQHGRGGEWRDKGGKVVDNDAGGGGCLSSCPILEMKSSLQKSGSGRVLPKPDFHKQYYTINSEKSRALAVSGWQKRVEQSDFRAREKLDSISNLPLSIIVLLRWNPPGDQQWQWQARHKKSRQTSAENEMSGGGGLHRSQKDVRHIVFSSPWNSFSNAHIIQYTFPRFPACCWFFPLAPILSKSDYRCLSELD